MIKITDKNRSLVFMLGTMILGILIIGILLFFENNDPGGLEKPTSELVNTFKPLERKINGLKTQNFDPNNYNTISTEINTSYDQQLITVDQKTNLMLSLTSVYSDLVYARCEFFLTGTNLDSSEEVTSLLNQLEKITAKNPRIDKYRNQIKWYQYYSSTLPAEVNKFIQSGITNYDENIYKMLMGKVQQMPNLESAYKNRSKFNKIKSSLTPALQNYNAEFYSQEMDEIDESKI